MFSAAEERSFVSWMRENENMFTGDEYHQRLGIFLANKRLVREHNAANKGFKVALNKFAALTSSEYKSLLGFKPIAATSAKAVKYSTNGADVDWRQKGCVNPIKDQGQCGSCWAFSAVQAVESCYAASTGTLYSLSESQLVDCCSACSGCDGGFPSSAYDWVIKHQNGGFMKEEDYPYSPSEHSCKFDPSKVVVTISGYSEVASGSESDLAAKCASVGPIAVGIDASNWSFQLYSSGIYDEPSCSSYSLDHAVGVIGYGSEGGVNYWIVRNSWGTSWGEEGYIRMVKDKNNQCGEATNACYPTF